MGQRLVVTVTAQQKEQMKIYYHWDAYTGSTFGDLQHLIGVIKPLREAGKGTSEILLAIIHALEKNGGGINGGQDSDEWKYIKQLYPDEAFSPEVNRNEGLVSMTEQDMMDVQGWSEGDAEINLDDGTFYNGVHFPYEKEVWMHDRVEYDEADDMDEAEELYEKLNVYGGNGSSLFEGDFDEIDGKYFDWLTATSGGTKHFRDRHNMVWEGVL